jgi:hypothetical protein
MVMGQAFAKPGADKVAEMERTLADLCESMYLVFENDWEHTQGAITQEGEAYFGRRGTFSTRRWPTNTTTGATVAACWRPIAGRSNSSVPTASTPST